MVTSARWRLLLRLLERVGLFRWNPRETELPAALILWLGPAAAAGEVRPGLAKVGTRAHRWARGVLQGPPLVLPAPVRWTLHRPT